MPQIVPLEVTANQELSFQADDNNYLLIVRAYEDFMTVDVSINEVFVIEGQRLIQSTLLIAYEWLEGTGGNFIFLSSTEDIIYYTEFGDTQALAYLTAEEVAEIRNA